MHLSITNFNITLTHSEAVDLLRSLVIGIRYTIVTHWRQHPKCWPEDESQRLNIVKELSRVTGHDYTSTFDDLTKLLNNKDEI